jgi:hypothetical protein
MRTHRTLLPILLPTLALPALLLASDAAEAAQLSISNGFRTAASYTSTGWDFSVHAEGEIELEQQQTTIPTAIDLDCSLDEQGEVIACVGELEIGNNVADIIMGLDDDTVYWAIDDDASVLFDEVHDLWRDDVVSRTISDPDGWSATPIFFGGQWRLWYYMTNWPEEFERISELEWEEIMIWEL